MLIKHHIITGTAISLFLLFFTQINITSAIIFLATSILIDVDHYLAYWQKTKDYSTSYKKIKKWCLTKGTTMEIYFIFHNIWFLTILIALVKYNAVFTPVLLGVSLHYICDSIWDVYWYKRGLIKKPYRRWII